MKKLRKILHIIKRRKYRRAADFRQWIKGGWNRVKPA
jgi:hypothetical protein